MGATVSRLTDLIAQLKAKDAQLGIDLEKEIKVLSSRLPFGLNFERHSPELVQLPSKRIRKNDKVQILPKRGTLKKNDPQIWVVKEIITKNNEKIAILESIGLDEAKQSECSIDDLVCVIQFRDRIYPSLISTDKVQNGGDKPFHTVINGENYHVLKALTFTHRGKLDVIYIDPPYNSGAKDWKYNNDYVEADDIYRHSKWLAMMERRLLVAKELLNPDDSVLIVTIDEKEVHRLRMLLEQVFPAAKVQMITTVISQNGTSREGEFSRVEEYILIARFGSSKIIRTNDNMLAADDKGKVSRVWFNFMRTSTPREKSSGQFYPIIINTKTKKIIEIGNPLEKTDSVPNNLVKDDISVIFPKKDDGTYATWGAVPKTAKLLFDQGFLRVGTFNEKTQNWSIQYVREGDRKRIEAGEIQIVGKDKDGSLLLEHVDVDQRENFPKTVWNRKSHDATAHGTRLNKALLPGRNFSYPKSLYAVEDVLRFFIKNKKNAVILDFFSGSGTTAHAVMRLNKQDNGYRQCISVTNNEVSAAEQKEFKEKGLRSGDADWEKWGICEYITKPRIKAAITGLTPEGSPIKGDYKFNDEFLMSDGLQENAEFFTLSYENKNAISFHIAFKRIAPLLWMRAGSRGRRIDEIPNNGWDIADTYGIIFDTDLAHDFCQEIKLRSNITIVYIVTEDEPVFQSIVKKLPKYIEPVRLYSSYLNNFSFTNGDD